MKQSTWLSTSLLTLVAIASAWGEPAERLIFSDAGVTMVEGDPRSAQPLAIAIADGRIAWMGAHKAGQERINPNTEVWQLGKQAVLPGFIDAHGHIVFSSLAGTLANVASPPVGPAEDIAGMQAALRDYIQRREIAPGDWVIGMGYDDSLLAERRHPTRDDLDAVTTDHPLFLLHVSGHLMAANSRALARAGINSETPDPPGGIVRRVDGEPNGVLEETAMTPLRRFMAAPNTNPLGALEDALAAYAKNGITTVQDGATDPAGVALLRQAADAGVLTLDVTAFPIGMVDPAIVVEQHEFAGYSNRLKFGGIKLFLDGSPQGKTAYMTKPYRKPPHGQDKAYRGYPTIPEAQANALFAAYLDAEVPILAHANGDAAADMLIHAVAEAKPDHDHRTVMIHAQTVREDQLTQMKNLGIVPSFFAAHSFYWGDWHRDSVFGVERAARISPTASTVARGMPFTIHNDAPVVPPDMLRLLWATTNRRTRSDALLGGEQRISTYDAIKAATVYAAYQNFEEASKGTIEVGKQADLVVLSADPLGVPPADLMSLEIRATLSRGGVVFRDAALAVE